MKKNGLKSRKGPMIRTQKTAPIFEKKAMSKKNFPKYHCDWL